MVLVCYVISQGHLIKGSCDSLTKSPWKEVTILLSLVAMETIVVEIFIFNFISFYFTSEKQGAYEVIQTK